MKTDKERLDVAIKRIRRCYDRIADDGLAHPDAVLSDVATDLSFLLDWLELTEPKPKTE